MESYRSIQTSMCKGLRATGLRKEEVRTILNIFQKWYRCNGPEWTNDRIKGYKQWYESYLAGDPKPPSWCRHTKTNMPCGVFNRLFRTKNQAKVLAALSANSVFVHRGTKPLSSQVAKFISGLNGGVQSFPTYEVSHARLDAAMITRGRFLPKRSERQQARNMEMAAARLGLDQIPTPTINQMVKSIPINSGRRTTRPSTRQERAEALQKSWESIPRQTADYLSLLGMKNAEPLVRDSYNRDYQRTVGTIACLQQPCLKARWIGNPNVVSQAAMRPLRELWNVWDRQDPCTCTEDQASGVRWVQEKLRNGVHLSGADMTSASDLLDLGSSLRLLELVQFGTMERYYLPWQYREAVLHFQEVSRGLWYANPRLQLPTETVRWSQGWCLGTAPSFPLLSLTNSALARWACNIVGIDPTDSYRVIGDDIILDTRAYHEYVRLVELFGGEINLSKTLSSDRVAEFAGNVITPDRVMRKTYRFKDPSDINFMSYVADLGPQAVGMLRPRQKRMYEEFKYIPGVVIDGPWIQDSFGEPLEKRLKWAYTQTGSLFGDRTQPDPLETTREAEWLELKLRNGLMDASLIGGYDSYLDYLGGADYRSAPISDCPPVEGDPRLRATGGKTTLQVLESVSCQPAFLPFEVWSQSSYSDDPWVQDMDDTLADEDLGYTQNALDPMVLADIAANAIEAMDSTAEEQSNQRKPSSGQSRP